MTFIKSMTNISSFLLLIANCVGRFCCDVEKIIKLAEVKKRKLCNKTLVLHALCEFEEALLKKVSTTGSSLSLP